jgi:hypothetical protein
MRGSTWFLIAAVAMIGYVIFSGGERRYARRAVPLDYDVVAVSQGLTPEAQALNLQDDLDVSLLPGIGRQAIRDAAQAGLREQAFLEAVLREVSERVREISTIDLNADGTADPILVRPEPAQDEGYVLLSLRVPAPDAYPLPAAGDAAAWKQVETVEVATMTVSLTKQELTVQATGSPYAYPDAAGQHYVVYDRSPSFLETYFAIRMLDWMFFPHYWGFWGPGWGYGFYRPYAVPALRDARGGSIRSRGYERAAASPSAAVRGRSGAAPLSRYERANPGRPPRALSQLRASRRFAARTPGSALRSGGFGRGGAAMAPGRSVAAPRGFGGYRSGAGSGLSRGFGAGGYSRGFGARGFGTRGFGGRGFGGFGRGMRFRR